MSSIEIKTSTLQPLRRSRLYWTIADALVLAKRQLKHIPRIPEELVFSTIQPIMFVLLFRYVFGGSNAVTCTTYVNYLMAGIFVQTIAYGSTSTKKLQRVRASTTQGARLPTSRAIPLSCW